MTYTPSMLLHILGGMLAIVAGFAALFVRKGSRIHRMTGNVFTASMLCMAAGGAYMAYVKWQPSNIIAGFIALLLLGFGMQRLDRSGHQQAQNTTAISPAIAISTSASMTCQWSRGSSGRCAIKIVSRASRH